MQIHERLQQFIRSFTFLVDRVGDDEVRIFREGAKLLSVLVGQDDWLSEDFLRVGGENYRQYLLYCDPMERFSVICFVWGPGQATPIHDHTVWGIVAVMRGAEICEDFGLDPKTGHLRSLGQRQLPTGGIGFVSPRVGDIHRVSNALADQTSISIHVYGANIGAVERHVYQAGSGSKKLFVSGYSDFN